MPSFTPAEPTPTDKTPEWISNYVVYKNGNYIEARFCLLDENKDPTSSQGTLSVTIKDETQKIVYSGSKIVNKADYAWYTKTLTGEKIYAYVWQIPYSSLQKGIGYGNATMRFTLPTSIYFQVYDDMVTIPTYTEEELLALYETQYQAKSTVIGQSLTKGSFKITVTRMGKYTYRPYSWSDEKTYFRVDFEVQNIASKSDYLFESNFVILDNLNNQYDQQYGGTLDLGELYAGVIRKGYLIFPELNPQANRIKILVTKSGYPTDTTWEFNISLIG